MINLDCDLALDESRSSARIGPIAKVAQCACTGSSTRGRGRRSPGVANGVISGAERFPFGISQVLDGLPNERVTESDGRLDGRDGRRVQGAHGVVHQHSTLGVA